MEVIEACVRKVSLDYLEIDPATITISFVNPIPIEDAVQAYSEHMSLFGGPVKIGFTEELIASMMKQMSKTREEVVKLFERSV
ncbi:hypothetical protein PaecuDRAFT_0946 [Paenibacillus curdlanolyticus YK9]|uniref:Uncharacterized protein n=1 Tax=Paenibacillus curdlanolyticus YK9 TaxID=717606 RepID=E0I5M4_9BACL|nr:hypothetical protein PaecuDRAFT_0946 [Paenibacillus curdlanolyticus YK9]